jgi:opacity protein-like surface antigen
MQKYSNEEVGWKDREKSDYNTFWFKFGAGADFPITKSFYIRTEFLYGFRPLIKEEKDWQAYYEQYTDKATAVGHGPTLKLGLGYTF